MKIHSTLPWLTIALLMAFAARAAEDPREKNAEKSPGLERFKLLAGDWTGKMTHDGEEMSDALVNYKVTSAGSAVVETIDPGGEHEMVTVR